MVDTGNQSSDYQGSQAYGQTLPSDESVSPNSGSVSYSRALISLRGKTASSGVSLKTSFTSGTKGSFGFPQNWGLDISFTIPHKSLTVQGRTYIVDPNWADISDYRSGLRYINHHGLKFERIYPALPLPSGHPGNYGWRFKMADGAVEYFDEYGKLLEHADIYGNSTYYTYVDETSDPRRCQLESIQDSWQQTVQIQYDMQSSVKVICPDGSSTTVNFGVRGVDSIEDALGNVTSFSYRQLYGTTVLDSVVAPTGLTTRFEYVSLHALDAGGGSYSIPACSLHIHQDVDGNEMDRTLYTYGEATGFANFSGAAIGCKISAAQDSLMESNNQDFRYDVAVSRLDANSSILQMSRVFYNYLHLSMTEEHYLLDGSGSPAPAYQTANTYDIPIDQHARATSFTQPIETRRLQYDSQTDNYQVLRSSKTSYNNFGNPLTVSDAVWNTETKDFQLQKTSTRTYKAVQWGGEMIETNIEKDLVTGREKQIMYSLTDDQRNIASTAVTYRDREGDEWLPWKTKSYKYDESGRVTSETLNWSPGASYPAGSVSEYTYTKSYSFDKETSMLTVTSVDPKGSRSFQQNLVSVTNGPLARKVSPLGIEETFKYDLLGRLVQLTDALGHVSNVTYSIGPGSYLQNRTALGYVTRTEFDVLGRQTRVLDNGHDGADVPTRVLVRTEFDAASRITKTINAVGLAATRSYDALGRMTSSVDIYGNVSTKTYDDVHLTTRQEVNGDLRVVQQANALGQTIENVVYGDSAANIGYEIVTRTTYNGFGNALSSTLIKKSATEESLLREQTVAYDVEGNPVRLVMISAASLSASSGAPDAASTDKVTRDIQFDIFGNSVTYTKTADYQDGRSYSHSGPVSEYDPCNRLVRLKNQLGQVETNNFDEDGRLTKMTRYDGSMFTFRYDKLGQETSSTGPDGSTRSEYLPNGRVKTRTVEEGQTVKTMQYEYSLDGSATAIHYPEGVTQHFKLDGFSRVQEEIDGAGDTMTFDYDDHGRLAAKQSPAAKVTYMFGTSNHTFGVLLETRITTPTQAQAREHHYDAFGRKAATIDRDAGGRTTLSSIYTYDARGRTLACEVQSAISDDKSVNCTRYFDYDGLGQLTSESRVPVGADAIRAQYVYDGNYNITEVMSNGQQASYIYNAVDQRADVGFTYDTNGRLVKDPDGRTYRYDSHDRLLSVTGGDVVDYAYHPDGSLAQRDSRDTKSAFYHDGTMINCIEDKTSGKTDWTSYMTHQAGRVAVNRSENSTLFVESQGSTVLSLDNSQDAVYTSSAYGQQISAAGARFGWKQELIDPDNGIVYLQSRYYSPRHMAFLTLDSSRNQENRYAFCNGDPVNLSDSSGHDAGAVAAAVVGNVVGILVTVASGGALVELGAAICAESNMAAVGIAAATISGAAGSLAGDATSAAMQKQSFTWARAGEDLLSGAIGGAVGAGSGGLASSQTIAFLEYAERLSPKAITGFGVATSLVIGGGAGSFAGAATSAAIHGEPIFSSKTALAALQGAAAAGAGGALWASASPLGLSNLEVIPRFITRSELDAGVLHQAWSLSAAVHDSDVFLMSTAGENAADFQAIRPDDKQLLRANNTTEHFTIVAHGDPKHLYASVRYQGREVYRPIHAALIGEAAGRYFRRAPFRLGAPFRDIKLLSCNGAIANAQSIATATGRRVWAAFGPIKVTEKPAWHLFTPKI